MKKIFILILLIIVCFSAQTQTIDSSSFIKNAVCAGDTITVKFRIQNYNSLTNFNLFWSNGSGAFPISLNAGSTSSGSVSPLLVFVQITVPDSFNGNNYKIRITGSTAKDTVMDSLNVFPKPKANFTIDSSFKCINAQLYNFTNGSTIVSGSITYRWNFGAAIGDTSILTSPTMSNYASSGSKTIQLICTSNLGCKDTINKSIVVHPKPTVNFTIDSSFKCINSQSFKFTNTSSVPYGSITYRWNFGEAAYTSTLTSPTMSNYDSSGTKAVKLISTSNFGCKDSITKNIVVHPKPTANFTIDSSLKCINSQLYKFTNGSSISYGSITYRWNFGAAAGDTSILTSPTMSNYATSGTKTVQLIPTSSFGCKDTISKTLFVHETFANFTIDSSFKCINAQLYKFTNTASALAGSITGNRWDFGGGAGDTSITASPTKSTYLTSGTKTIQLISTSNFGCKDTISKTLVVHPKPTVNFTIDSSFKCINSQSFKFNNTSSVPYGSILVNRWNFGGGLGDTSLTTSPTKSSYLTSGSKTIQLIITSSFGCKDTISKTLVVHPKPTASFTIDSSFKCINSQLYKFTNGSSVVYGSIVNTRWNFGEGLGDTSLTSSPTKSNYSSSGSKIVQLIITNSFGCKDTSSKVLVVHPKPTANFIIDSSFKCINKQLYTFTNSSSVPYGNITINRWNFGEGFGDTSLTTSPTKSNYTTIGTKSVQLITTSIFGCKDVITKILNVYPKPYASFSSFTSPFCNQGNPSFKLKEDSIKGQTRTLYNWSRNNNNINGIFGNNANDSIVSSSFSNNTDTTQVTSFKFTPITNFGCIGDTISKDIVFYPKPKVSSNLTNIARICSGDNTPIINFSTPTKYLDSLSRITKTSSPNILGFSGGNGFSVSSSKVTISDSSTGYIYYATTPWAHNCNGDIIRDSVFVNPKPVIFSFAPSTQTLCSGDNNAPVLIKTQTSFDKTFYTYTAVSKKGTTSGFSTNGILGFKQLLPNFKISNTGNRIDSVVFTFIPHYVFYHRGVAVDTCVGSSTNYIVVVNPLPKLFNAGITSICSGEQTSTIPFTTNILDNGTFYRWKEKLNGNTKQSGASSGIGSIPPFIYFNNQKSTDKVDYTVTAYFTFNNDTCEGETKVFSQYINPKPVITNTIKSETICSGTKFKDYILTNDIIPQNLGSTYTWKIIYQSPLISNTPIQSGNGDTITSQQLINSSTLDKDTASVIYEITPFYNNPTYTASNTCEGTKSLFKVVVQPLPPLPIIDTFVNATVCDGSKGLNYSVNADPSKRYFWSTIPSDASIQGINGTSCVINLPDKSSSDKYQVNVKSTNLYGCHVQTSTILNIDTTAAAPSVNEILLLKNNTFFCKNNSSVCYQWGRDYKTNLVPEEIKGEIYQKYIAGNSLDTSNYFYWVITCDNVSNSCKTKSYYNQPSNFINGLITDNGKFGVSLFPNPCSTEITVMIHNKRNFNSYLTASIYDVCGKEILTKPISVLTDNFKINLEEIPNGIYFLQIKSNQEYSITKFIKAE